MAKVDTNDVVSSSYVGPDRRRSSPLRRIERLIIRMVRSKWVAAFVTAIMVSWCFHIVEERADKKLAVQQYITDCTVTKVAEVQAFGGRRRVEVAPILEACKKQAGK
jgi:hypothetical protein